MNTTPRFGATPSSPEEHSDPEKSVPLPRSLGDEIAANPQPTLNYTIVALAGVLAGFILGTLYNGRLPLQGSQSPSAEPRPRALVDPTR